MSFLRRLVAQRSIRKCTTAFQEALTLPVGSVVNVDTDIYAVGKIIHFNRQNSLSGSSQLRNLTVGPAQGGARVRYTCWGDQAVMVSEEDVGRKISITGAKLSMSKFQ